MTKNRNLLSIICFLSISIPICAQNIQISTITRNPSQNIVLPDANIVIEFDQTINGAMLNDTTVIIRGRQSGILSGEYGGGGTSTITLNPDSDLRAGENISVTVTQNLKSEGGFSLSRGHTYSFTIQSSSSPTTPLTLSQRNVGGGGGISGQDIAAINFDDDGGLDLVSCSFSELFWHENDGRGTFTTIPITTSGTPLSVFAFDQNEDGYIDIWIDNDGSSSSMLYTNDGNQNFTEGTITGSLRLKQLTDVNHDGDTDIVYLSRTDSWFRWSDFRCDLYGSFGYTPNLINRDIQAGDMDLVTLSENDDELMWFENSGSTLSIDQEGEEVPHVFRLDQNYPNPFNPSTITNYELRASKYL